MELGNFSLSLAVKDLQASKEFYEALGFTVFHGNPQHGYIIMQHGNLNIGLFQGMFENNIFTFNPGWDNKANALESFTDVREIQKHLKSKGITPISEVDESGSGPGNFMVTDPDGNTILFDQHV